jgi:hypothetical protein
LAMFTVLGLSLLVLFVSPMVSGSLKQAINR